MKRVGTAALVASTIGPVQSVLGWVISGSLWDGYDPIKKTISDLAADDSPVRHIQTSFFFLGATLTLIGAISARALALPGRVALILAGLATYALAIFSTPSQVGHSDAHRLSATISFVLMSAWPILSMRLDTRYPWVLRPIGAIGATLGLTVISIWFLSTWLDPNSTLVGLSERVIVTTQVLWLSLTIWVCWGAQRKAEAMLVNK